MRRNTKISLIFGALLAGVMLGRFGFTFGVSLLPVVVAACAALLLGRTRLALGGLLALALVLGLWRTGAWTADRAQLTSLIGQNVTVTGTIIDDPSLSDKGLLTFKLGYLKLGGRDLPGELTVRLYRLQLQRGYQIQATGKVKPGFGNAVAELGFPQTQVVSRQQDWLEQLRQRFFVGIRTALPEPIASFGLGLLVGIRALIPKAMQTELTLVGLSHLVAVSGYNLTIIVQAVDRALGRFGRSVALAASLWLIAGFLILTGASASIVRASLVSVLSLLAAFYGRRFDPLALILVAASLTAMYDPKYLTDLGWLLSFLAFFGILVLAPALEARLGHPKPVLVRLFIESFAAQITTTPLILYFFGQLSIVAPVSNLIILPMVPLAMALSFAAGLAGMLLPAFAGWLAWPAMLLLTFMTQIVSQFAALPWAGTTMHIDLLTMLAMYALTVLVVIAIKRANRSRGVQEDHDHMFESIHT